MRLGAPLIRNKCFAAVRRGAPYGVVFSGAPYLKLHVDGFTLRGTKKCAEAHFAVWQDI